MDNNTNTADCTDSTNCISLAASQSRRRNIQEKGHQEKVRALAPEIGAFSQLQGHRILESILDEFDEDISIPRLQEKTGVTYTGLWYCLRGKRKWNVELWLDVLMSLGVVDVEKDKIVIHTRPGRELRKKNKRLANL